MDSIGTIPRCYLFVKADFVSFQGDACSLRRIWCCSEVRLSFAEVPAQAISVGGCSRPNTTPFMPKLVGKWGKSLVELCSVLFHPLFRFWGLAIILEQLMA